MQPPRRSRRQKVELPPARPLDYKKLSDPILVTRAKDGDRQALAELCVRHAPRVQRLATRLLSDPEDARDAAQDALTKVCVRIRQFRGDAEFTTWLHRLVVNTCRDVAERQRSRRCEPLVEDRRVAADGDPARALDLSELRSELSVELGGISEQQARVLVLKDAFEWSFAEIASVAGIPVGTAKCYAHRARSSLRDRLATG